MRAERGTQTFTYDELNRISTAQSEASSGPYCWGHSYSYDRWANYWQTSSTKCSSFSSCYSVNSANQLYKTCSEGSQSLFYDAAGSLTNDHGVTYTWDAEGRLKATAGVNYTYDGDGRRVKKDNGKLYWYGVSGEVLFETDLAGNLIAEYIYLGGLRIARRDASGAVYYLFQDHLGSLRLITNALGNTVRQIDYDPWGREVVDTGTVDDAYRFAGMEKDSESGLYHTWYRKYSTIFGCWLSTDPERCGVDNPQAFDRYTYALDNPTNLIDPLGLQVCSLFCNDLNYAVSHPDECRRCPGDPCPMPHPTPITTGWLGRRRAR